MAEFFRYKSAFEDAMAKSLIRFSTFPRTEPPAAFVKNIVGAFQAHEGEISTERLEKGLTSDEVLSVVRDDLVSLGFEVEAGKRKVEKIERPVLFGEDGEATVRYEIDAYQPEWRCGLEVEAGRGWMGNAVYRDLILASVMVDVDYFWSWPLAVDGFGLEIKRRWRASFRS